MSDVAGITSAEEGARAYAAACAVVVSTATPCIEVAQRAINARKLAQQGHEISRENFRHMAAEQEAQFTPLYKAFEEACAAARNVAAAFRAVPSTDDVELVLHNTLDDETYAMTETAGHLLRGTFRPTSAGFWEGMEPASEAMHADIYYFGDDGFIGHVYAPPISDERACPWCAETIKSAAKICRFCNRDVEAPTNSL